MDDRTDTIVEQDVQPTVEFEDLSDDILADVVGGSFSITRPKLGGLNIA